MEYNVMEMQAIEYELRQFDLSYSPWYKVDSMLFSPIFFNFDGTDLSVLINQDNYLPHFVKLTQTPLLFYWSRDDLSGHNYTDTEFLEAIKERIHYYHADEDEAVLIPMVGRQHTYQPVSIAPEAKLDNDIKLYNFELTSDSYELIGFSKN